jgi:putative tryptophan/tyrosine transport system substrate-binding protein
MEAGNDNETPRAALRLCHRPRLLRIVLGAQYSGRVFKLGVLALGSAKDQQNRLALLREPLRDLGYEEGKSLVVESRFANSDYEQLSVLASELARLKIDVFVAAGNRRCSQRKKRARISQSL